MSTHVDGQAAGYGEAVVQVRVDAAGAQLEDEFPDGEQHFRIPLDRAQVVAAFTVAQDGTRVPLTAPVMNTREASFPSPAPARDVIAGTDRPPAGAPRTRGPQLQR